MGNSPVSVLVWLSLTWFDTALATDAITEAAPVTTFAVIVRSTFLEALPVLVHFRFTWTVIIESQEGTMVDKLT